MQAGLLRHIISFKKNEPTKDGYGALKDNWIKAFDRRSRVQFNSDSRKELNGEITNITIYTFTIRYCKDVTYKMIIFYEGQKYRIISINPDYVQQSVTVKAELING